MKEHQQLGGFAVGQQLDHQQFPKKCVSGKIEALVSTLHAQYATVRESNGHLHLVRLG